MTATTSLRESEPTPMTPSEPREDAVAALLAACCEYFGPMDDPSICWVGRSPSHPDLFKCERCDAEHRDCAEIPHKPYCRAVKLRDALIAALSQQGAEPVAYLAESANEAYVFFANDHESLDAYTADDFTITPLARQLADADKVPQEVVRQQSSLLHPATQVFFRAGLIACREYMARFAEAESPSIAASIRANWWPSLGADFGPPRKIEWGEITEGEFGENGFRVKSAEEVSPTLEALPIALAFLEQPATGAPR